MPGPYSARDVIKVLTDHGWRRADSGGGSHEKFVYTDPNTGERRVVTVPLHGEIAPGTLDEIAKQAGANDVQAFRDWLDGSL
jgi:predicted RNA binding protein YcfA (HicA-like mRNA interferase family)